MKTLRIILEPTHLVAVGPYLANVEYEVEEEQAKFLVAHKGFRLAFVKPAKFVPADPATPAEEQK